MILQHIVHTDPHLSLQDETILARFLSYARIDPAVEQKGMILEKLCRAVAEMPYENLTKIIKSDEIVNPGSSKRLPDEVLRDFLEYGSGGTCFSLTAAFVALFNASGFEAHPILADRHYGVDTHCALVLVQNAELLLLDPGYLIHTPIRLPTLTPVTVSTSFNTLELAPRDAGQKVDLITIVNTDRRPRLTYKIALVDGQTFGRAWERSFAWEMMTYPVLTRYSNGVHYYLQGNQLRIRDQQRTTRRTLSPEERQAVMCQTFGLNKRIVAKACLIV